MPAGRHPDNTADSRRFPLYVHDYRAFRTVQAAPQTANHHCCSQYQVVTRSLVVGAGGLYAVVEWVPVAMLLVQFSH